MRILVTGITGQVGAALLPALADLGTVIGTDRRALDLAVPETIGAALDHLKPDLILNPAAYTAVDRAEDERDLAFTVNAKAPQAIAHWAATRGIPLMHLSTDYVFNGTGTTPWREDDATGPLSIYGASKLAGETAIRAAGAPHLIVRTSWVYAAKGANFLRTIARLAGERDELHIVADQIGAPTSAALIATTIAQILRATRSDLPAAFAKADGLIHLVASGETSWHGFATAIVDGLRTRGVSLKAKAIHPIATADFPTKARRPANSRLSMDRLQRVFGLTTPDWMTALQPELEALARELTM